MYSVFLPQKTEHIKKQMFKGNVNVYKFKGNFIVYKF